jgi:hypothetical protein
MYKDKKVLRIDSSNRTSGTNEDFIITKTVQEFPLSPKSVKLVSAAIPYTWNNVTATNNRFNVLIPGINVITIPTGNYTGTDLAAAIQVQLVAIIGAGWTCTFSTQTLKYTITSPGPVFQLDYTVANSAYILMGFNNAVYPLVPATPVTSPNYAVLLKDVDICICSDLVEGADNGVIPYTQSSTPSSYGILASIPIYCKYPTILKYIATPDLPYFIVTQSKFALPQQLLASSTRTMRFYLKFLSGEPVDLKGYPWNFTIIFDFNNV